MINCNGACSVVVGPTGGRRATELRGDAFWGDGPARRGLFAFGDGPARRGEGARLRGDDFGLFVFGDGPARRGDGIVVCIQRTENVFAKGGIRTRVKTADRIYSHSNCYLVYCCRSAYMLGQFCGYMVCYEVAHAGFALFISDVSGTDEEEGA